MDKRGERDQIVETHVRYEISARCLIDAIVSASMMSKMTRHQDLAEPDSGVLESRIRPSMLTMEGLSQSNVVAGGIGGQQPASSSM